MQNISDLKPLLELSHPRPLRDNECIHFGTTLNLEKFLDETECRDEFFSTFRDWITKSNLNQLTGLDKFPVTHFSLGVTQCLDELHLLLGENLVVFDNDYKYHWRLRPNIKIRTVETLCEGDHLVISMPSPWYGDLHPQMKSILEACENKNIPIHLDCAWYGCVRDINFDYDHPAIKSLSFSLSKGLCLGQNRIGIRFSREPIEGPLKILHDFEMGTNLLMWYGVQYMNKFSCDHLQNKYGKYYKMICDEFGLLQSKTIFLAHTKDNHGDLTPVGIRKVLNKVHNNY